MINYTAGRLTVTLSVNVRAIAPVLRGMGVVLIDLCTWGMHPLCPGPFAKWAIVTRYRLEHPQ